MASSKNAPIIHCLPSTDSKPGFQATLLLQKHLPLPFTTNNVDIAPDHAYLIACKPNEKFEKISKKTLKISISLYLDLLLFFQTVWPKVEKKMSKLVDKMRKTQAPSCEKNFQCSISGTANYQCYFGDALLEYRQYSESPYLPFIQLTKNQTSVCLDAEVMTEMSKEWKKIIFSLQNDGYSFPELKEKP